jgi:hypothetical protein
MRIPRNNSSLGLWADSGEKGSIFFSLKKIHKIKLFEIREKAYSFFVTPFLQGGEKRKKFQAN